MGSGSAAGAAPPSVTRPPIRRTRQPSGGWPAMHLAERDRNQPAITTDRGRGLVGPTLDRIVHPSGEGTQGRQRCRRRLSRQQVAVVPVVGMSSLVCQDDSLLILIEEIDRKVAFVAGVVQHVIGHRERSLVNTDAAMAAGAPTMTDRRDCRRCQLDRGQIDVASGVVVARCLRCARQIECGHESWSSPHTTMPLSSVQRTRVAQVK